MQWFKLIWDVSSYLRRLSSRIKASQDVSWEQVLKDMTAFMNRAFDILGAPSVEAMKAAPAPVSDPLETTTTTVEPVTYDML